MAEIKYEIIENLAVLSEGNKGWRKELNLISWNEREPKYDIRDWSQDHKKMGKGITFSLSEIPTIKRFPGKYFRIGIDHPPQNSDSSSY